MPLCSNNDYLNFNRIAFGSNLMAKFTRVSVYLTIDHLKETEKADLKEFLSRRDVFSNLEGAVKSWLKDHEKDRRTPYVVGLDLE